jgi:very-short-patch-repair endonuclease
MLIATRRNPSARQAALLAARAHGLRKAPTLSEARLWRELSAGKVLGVRFRRQVPVGGRWVADFVAPALRLIVEVDGSAHEHRRRVDARRDEKLRRLGYHVLRLEAEVVMRDLPRAVAVVREAVEALRR